MKVRRCFIRFLLLLNFIITGSILNVKAAGKDSILSRNIWVKDVNQYSKHYLKSLVEEGSSWNFKLIDSFLIFKELDSSNSSWDTAYVSSNLKLHKAKKLSGCKGRYCCTLDIERINYTTVEYGFQIVIDNKAMTKEVGFADLNP